MAKWRKKPVVVEAEVYKPGMEDGYVVQGDYGIKYMAKEEGNEDWEGYKILKPAIRTLEGWHEITEGDYIITGIKGERYPCKPDIFHQTYEAVEDA